jgi:CobQ-like glutamine amidotransferase family enzyme
MEVLSDEIVPEEGSSIDGLGFFHGRALRGATRRANYFEVTTDYRGASLALFGFEDHASRFELSASAAPFGTVVHGGGNGDGTEGVVRGASFGTQLKGPVLPLNPELTDRVLTAALAGTSGDYRRGSDHDRLDEYARRSRQVIEENLQHAFKSM